PSAGDVCLLALLHSVNAGALTTCAKKTYFFRSPAVHSRRRTPETERAFVFPRRRNSSCDIALSCDCCLSLCCCRCAVAGPITEARLKARNGGPRPAP